MFIAGLLHATLQAEGIVLVIGEVGSGKTLMSRILLSRLSKQVDTVYLPNPAFSRDEIIEVIARDLGIEGAAPLGQGLRLEALQQELIKRHEQGRRVVVLIDEAHAMPMESIEEVRRLTNLETDNRKLVQVVLFGQPELDTLLDTPHLRQVRDRVVYRLVLRNLSSLDSRAYIEHRLRVAEWRGGRMFSWCAEQHLIHDAKGRARRINILADKALLAAYADNKKQVLARHVRLAIRDAGTNFATPGNSRRWPWRMLTAWAASIAVTVVFSLWYSSWLTQHRGVTASPVLQAVPAAKPASAPLQHSESPAPSPPQAADVAPSPAPVVPQEKAKPEVIVPDPPQSEDIDNRVKQSYAYARQQSTTGYFAIQLATLPFTDRVLAFMESAEEMLPPGQIYVRRRFVGGRQAGSRQTSYAIYFGSFETDEAARRAIADMPPKLRKEKPTIRTWKEIFDAPWSQ